MRIILVLLDDDDLHYVVKACKGSEISFHLFLNLDINWFVELE